MTKMGNGNARQQLYGGNMITERYKVYICFAVATAEDEIYIAIAMTKEELRAFQQELNIAKFVEVPGKQIYSKDGRWHFKKAEHQSEQVFVNTAQVTNYSYSVIEVQKETEA
jgi:hypothetical protein